MEQNTTPAARRFDTPEERSAWLKSFPEHKAAELAASGKDEAAINARALRRWINENYEGAASCASWTLKECIEFVEEYHVDGLAPFIRTVIRHDLVQNFRTPRQVEAAVRSLNRKFARTNRHGLAQVVATLEDGAIAVRYVEADRTMTGQPDAIHAEGYLDVNMSAVWLYREAQNIYRDGLHNSIQGYLKANPLGPTPASTESWD